nr:BTAD domain-containing putative transcriptional regulator [Angustibacter aerolatus]
MGPGLSGASGPPRPSCCSARSRSRSRVRAAAPVRPCSRRSSPCWPRSRVAPGRRPSLVEAVWGSSAPDRAAASLHTHVWALRRLLGAEHIVRSAGGYALVLPDDACDVDQAQAAPLAASRAVADGDPERAAAVLGDALGLWRGSALAGVPGLAADAHRAEPRAARARIAEQARGACCWASAGPTRRRRGSPRWSRPTRCASAGSALLVTALLAAGRRTDAQREPTRVRRALREEPGPGAGRGPAAARRAGSTPTATAPARCRGACRPAPQASAAEPPSLQQVVAAVVQGSDPGQDGALVAVTGAGGLGKTALAVQVAHQARDGLPRRAPVRGVPRARPERGRAHRRRRAARLPAGPGHRERAAPFSLDEQTTLLRSLLHGRRVLLLLDDVPGPDVVRALLPASGVRRAGHQPSRGARAGGPRGRARGGAAALLDGRGRGAAARRGRPRPRRRAGGQRTPAGGAAGRGSAAAGRSGCGSSPAAWPGRARPTSTGPSPRLVDVRTRLHRLGVPDDPQSDVRTVLQWSVDEFVAGRAAGVRRGRSAAGGQRERAGAGRRARRAGAGRRSGPGRARRPPPGDRDTARRRCGVPGAARPGAAARPAGGADVVGDRAPRRARRDAVVVRAGLRCRAARRLADHGRRRRGRGPVGRARRARGARRRGCGALAGRARRRACARWCGPPPRPGTRRRTGSSRPCGCGCSTRGPSTRASRWPSSSPGGSRWSSLARAGAARDGETEPAEPALDAARHLRGVRVALRRRPAAAARGGRAVTGRRAHRPAGVAAVRGRALRRGGGAGWRSPSSVRRRPSRPGPACRPTWPTPCSRTVAPRRRWPSPSAPRRCSPSTRTTARWTSSPS